MGTTTSPRDSSAGTSSAVGPDPAGISPPAASPPAAFPDPPAPWDAATAAPVMVNSPVPVITICKATFAGIPRTFAISAAICAVESPAAFPAAISPSVRVFCAACACWDCFPYWATALPYAVAAAATPWYFRIALLMSPISCPAM